VSKEDAINGVRGNNFVTGEYWIDHETFLKISSEVNYEIPLKSFTDIARRGFAVTSEMSLTADTIIAVTLLQNVFALKGTAASQLEKYKNGIREIYKGGFTQLWILN